MTTRHALADGDLPIPSVTWEAKEVSLETTALAAGLPGSSALLARYRLANRTSAAKRIRLVLAIRPLQVNPPWQFLGTPGGVSEIRSLAFENGRAVVNGTRFVVPLSAPSAAGATAFDSAGRLGLPPRRRLPPPAP